MTKCQKIVTEENAKITVDQEDLAVIMSFAYNILCEYSGHIPASEIAAYNRIAAIAGIELEDL